MNFSPEIVFGPPGCGKTTTLLNMVDEELTRGVPPDRIGYVSFTRKAATEAAERACAKFKLTKRQFPWFRTIHSLCFAALGLNSSDVLEGRRLSEFGDWIGVPVSGKVSMEDGTTFGFDVGDRCLFMENLARVRGVTLRQQYEQDHDDLSWRIVERVAEGLAAYKKAHHLYDFTDMVSMFVETDWTARLEVLFVDEAQDLSALQWRVVEKLARGARRVVIAGDDDQAIFRWAGADVEAFLQLPGTARVLGQSWRVPQAVQGLATGLVSGLQHRKPKEWLPRPAEGAVRRVQNLDEIDFSAGDDVLVLARNACFLRDDAMPLLRSEGVLYEFRGAASVKPSVVAAILDWEKLRRGERITAVAARGVYELMVAGEGYARGSKKLPGVQDETELTMTDLRAGGGLLAPDEIWHSALTRITREDRAYMLKALKRGEKLRQRPTVRLSTVHGSKGGEAAHVVLLRDMAPRTYRELDNNPDDERRVFYVAATRAKDTLTVVAPQTRRSYDI